MNQAMLVNIAYGEWRKRSHSYALNNYRSEACTKSFARRDSGTWCWRTPWFRSTSLSRSRKIL